MSETTFKRDDLDKSASSKADVESSQAAGGATSNLADRSTERTTSAGLGVERGAIFNTTDTDVGEAESQKRGVVVDANMSSRWADAYQQLHLRIAQNQAGLDNQIQQNAITAQANVQALLTQVLAEQARLATRQADLACNHQWHTQPTEKKPA